MIRTYGLLVPSHSVGLIANLIDFDFDFQNQNQRSIRRKTWQSGSLNLSQVGVVLCSPNDDKPFPVNLPGPQAMRDSTRVDRKKCRARCVHARIIAPGSLSLYAPGKETVWLACPSASRRGSRFTVGSQVDAEAAARREEDDTYWRPTTTTASLLDLSGPIRLVADLVDFEPLGH